MLCRMSLLELASEHTSLFTLTAIASSSIHNATALLPLPGDGSTKQTTTARVCDIASSKRVSQSVKGLVCTHAASTEAE